MHKRRVYRRRYKSRRSSKPKLHLKKNKKKINMVKNDFQYGGWNSYTLQCGKWLWDDTPLNSPKRPPYWNSTVHLVSISITSPQSTCHSEPVSEILSKSDHARQKKMTSYRFSKWRISAILDFRGPIMGSLKSQYTTSYRSSIETIALNCLVFEKNTFFAFWRQTDKQTDEQMDSIDALSRSHCCERRLSKAILRQCARIIGTDRQTQTNRTASRR